MKNLRLDSHDGAVIGDIIGIANAPTRVIGAAERDFAMAGILSSN